MTRITTVLFAASLLFQGFLFAESVSAPQCSTKDDCELIPQDCCTCEQGGERIAALKGMMRKMDCSAVMCSQTANDTGSCDMNAEADCNDGVCVIAGPITTSVPDTTPVE